MSAIISTAIESVLNDTRLAKWSEDIVDECMRLGSQTETTA